MINRVDITRLARKQLRKVPLYIARKLAGWVISVDEKGIEEMRKLSGYHDEPLKGRRRGKHSIRLSISYRAIYRICKNGTIEFVSVEEVTKHRY